DSPGGPGSLQQPCKKWEMQEVIAELEQLTFTFKKDVAMQKGVGLLPFLRMDSERLGRQGDNRGRTRLGGELVAAVTGSKEGVKGAGYLRSPGKLCPFRHNHGSKQVVCKHWLRGLCKKGDQCKFLHQYDVSRVPTCYFYSEFGGCNNKECSFLHVNPAGKSWTCPWYDQGFCKDGPLCKYRHVRRKMYTNYLVGFCPQGPECQFAHPKMNVSFHPSSPKERESLQLQRETEYGGGRPLVVQSWISAKMEIHKPISSIRMAVSAMKTPDKGISEPGFRPKARPDSGLHVKQPVCQLARQLSTSCFCLGTWQTLDLDRVPAAPPSEKLQECPLSGPGLRRPEQGPCYQIPSLAQVGAIIPRVQPRPGVSKKLDTLPQGMPTSLHRTFGAGLLKGREEARVVMVWCSRDEVEMDCLQADPQAEFPRTLAEDLLRNSSCCRGSKTLRKTQSSNSITHTLKKCGTGQKKGQITGYQLGRSPPMFWKAKS
ncbi:putative cleavage and polyadenylation specificity factor subunit 4-like protein, partial [Galemys pyrenaicus]